MCGLVGIYHRNARPIDPGVLVRMTDVQRHRGPDDQGFRTFSLARGATREFPKDAPSNPDGHEGAFGFNRLSILDLSEAGHQPMVSGDGRVVIAFNGEVYNAFDFVPELKAAGFTFRGHSDTEVILAMYQHFGIEGMLSRLNGMFAICLADLARQELHLIRDHAGIKPLYYATLGAAGAETLVFGSEIKSLLLHPGVPREVDPAHLDEQLLFRYVTGEDTIFKGIRQLRPGFRLLATPRGTSVHRWYEIPEGDPQPWSDAETMARVEDGLSRSVKSQLISDVKVGCQLSGGIDSSLVTAIARDRYGADMESFSVIFADSAVSEEAWMRVASEKTNTKSHFYELSVDNFLANVRKATWHMDYPLNLANAVGLFLLSKGAREHVTVLLSGDGADECVGGYQRFWFALTRDRLGPLVPLLRGVPKLGPKLVRNYAMPPGLPFDEWYVNYSASMRFHQFQALRRGSDPRAVLGKRLAIFREGRGSRLHNCLRYETQTFLSELLIRQDKMMMAHSIENRVPMLDREQMALIRRLPERMLVNPRILRRQAVERGTKVVLKRLASRRFGEGFAFRPKIGFGLPMVKFFTDPRADALFEESLLPGMRRRGWVSVDAVQDWRAKTRAGDPWHVEGLWTVMALELWAQEHLDASMPSAQAARPAVVASV